MVPQAVPQSATLTLHLAPANDKSATKQFAMEEEEIVVVEEEIVVVVEEEEGKGDDEEAKSEISARRVTTAGHVIGPTDAAPRNTPRFMDGIATSCETGYRKRARTAFTNRSHDTNSRRHEFNNNIKTNNNNFNNNMVPDQMNPSNINRGQRKLAKLHASTGRTRGRQSTTIALFPQDRHHASNDTRPIPSADPNHHHASTAAAAITATRVGQGTPNGLSKKTPRANRARAAQSGRASQQNATRTSSVGTSSGIIIPPLRGLAKNQRPPTRLQQHPHNNRRPSTVLRGLRKNQQNRPRRSQIHNQNEMSQQMIATYEDSINFDEGQPVENENIFILHSSLDDSPSNAQEDQAPHDPSGENLSFLLSSSLDDITSTASGQEDQAHDDDPSAVQEDDAPHDDDPPSGSPNPLPTLPRSNSGLAVARAIYDDSAGLTVEAQEVDPEASRRKKMEEAKHQRKNFLILVLVFICIVLGVTFGVVVHNKNKELEMPSQAPSVVPSMAPSDSPSSAPSGPLDFLLAHLPEHTLESLSFFSTHQSEAYRWLENHPHLSNFEEWRKKQLFALATFYFSFDGENWYKPIRERWMDYEMEECYWYSSGFGVFDMNEEYLDFEEDLRLSPTPSCNDDGEFTLLYLQDLQLSWGYPTMPPEIALLTSLSGIWLGNSLGMNDIRASLSDMLPSELGQLTNLTGVSFSGNHLTDSMPSELGLMTRLSTLDLAANRLTGPLVTELGLMTRLSRLDLAVNNLNASIPSVLGVMTSLTQLNLYSNSLSGPLPTELGLITSLTRLELHDNDLNGPLPSEFGLMTSLSYVDLSRNRLSGLNGNDFPSEVGLMTSLTTLKLAENSLNSSIPSEVGKLSNLTMLDLHSNSLNCVLPSELGVMTSLTSLSLSHNSLSGPLPTELGLITILSSLELRDNDLGGPVPSELGLMTNLSRHVDLARNSLTGSIPSELGLLKDLRSLDLRKNLLTGVIPPQVIALNLGWNLKLEGNGNLTLPTEMGLLANLSSLPLQYTRLTDSIPSEVGMMTSLISLKLHRNALTGPLPTELGLITSLTRLELHDNDLNGPLPSELGLMTSLSYVDLSRNRLSGSIPSELAQLKRMNVLDLHENFLTGVIPSQLIALTSTKLNMHINSNSNLTLSEETGLLSSLVPRLFISKSSALEAADGQGAHQHNLIQDESLVEEPAKVANVGSSLLPKTEEAQEYNIFVHD